MTKLWLDSLIQNWRSELGGELDRGAERHFLTSGANRSRLGRSIWAMLRGDEHRFLVYPNGEAVVDALDFSVSRSSDGRVLNLQLGATVNWDSEHIHIGVAALGADLKPTATFMRLVRDRIAGWTKEHSDALFDDYPHQIDALVADIRAYARDELALLLSDIHIGPNPIDLGKLAQGEYSIAGLGVKTKDAPNQDVYLDLRYKVDYERDNPVAALLSGFTTAWVRSAVEKLISAEFLQNITLTDVVLDFPTEVRPALANCLRSAFRKRGGRLEWLEARAISKFPVPTNSVEKDFTLNCHVKKAGSVSVQHKIRLKVEDVAKYLDAGVSSLESWAQTTAEDVTKARLFDHSYVDVALYFDQREKEIQEEFAREAERIGVAVRLHATTSPLPIIQAMREGVNVDTEAANWTFKVKDAPKPFIPLFVRGRVVLTDAQQLSHIFNQPTTDVQPLIVEDIREAIKDTLLNTYAEDYFENFESPDGVMPAMRAGQDSVKDKLNTAIASRLQERYGECELYLDVHRALDPVSQRLHQLRNGKYTLSVRVVPKARRESLPVPFVIQFSIEQVQDYQQFVRHEYASKDEEIDAIRRTWEGVLRKALETLSLSVLVQYHTAENEGWERQLEAIVKESARKTSTEYGLELKIIYWDREGTLKDQAWQTIYKIKIEEAKDAQLREIDHRKALGEKEIAIVENEVDSILEKSGAEDAQEYIDERRETQKAEAEDPLGLTALEESDEASVARSRDRLTYQQQGDAQRLSDNRARKRLEDKGSDAGT